MERIDQFSFYRLGQTLKQLGKYSGDVRPIDCFFDVWTAQSALESLLRGVPIPLGVSKAAAVALNAEVSRLFDEHFRSEKGIRTSSLRFPDESDATIPPYYWSIIESSLSKFETVFAAEMAETTTYFVPRRGIFFTPALVDVADESFPQHLGPVIPNKAKEEWRSAGRCLAFNLLSASGFHVARAVEGMLEVYYQTFYQQTDATLKTWGDYHDKLAKLAKAEPPSSPKPSQKVLDELKQMKDDYRNPIMHPRVVLKEGDARMLWDNGESLIIAMAEELLTVKKVYGGVQAPLSFVSPRNA